MRIISFFTTCLTALLLAACGGGGGSPGVGSGSVQAFSVAAPAAVTLQVGLTQQYSVQGGQKPYTVFSNNPAVAVGWLIGENVFAVGTTAAGVATVSVVDAKGAKFDLAVTAGSTTEFFTTASDAMTITPGPRSAQTYVIGGGVAPYTATSSFPSVASVVVNGNQMTITGIQVSVTTANITIRDSSGKTLSVAVTVGTVPLAISPDKLEAPTGVVFRSVITGGTPPYRTVILDNCATNVQIIQGNILQATTAMACKGAVITVVDANNQTTAVTFDVGLGTVGLQIAPSAFTVTESENTPDLSLLVYGANGPLQIFTTNPGVLAPKLNTVVSPNPDGTFTIQLTGGNTCYDARGVDNTVPADGLFTGVRGIPNLTIQPVDDVAPQPTKTITLTVLDATGRQGTSKFTIADNGKGGAGCN